MLYFYKLFENLLSYLAEDQRGNKKLKQIVAKVDFPGNRTSVFLPFHAVSDTIEVCVNMSTLYISELFCEMLFLKPAEPSHFFRVKNNREENIAHKC